MRVSKWAVAIGAMSLAVAAAAQQPDTQYTPGPKPDPAAVARGQQIFLTNCSFCHAADATGASGPDLLRSPVVLRDQHGESIGDVVRGGRPGTAMPPFPAMTDAQLSDISAFLRGRIQEAANRMAYSFKGLVTGDAKQGAAYFNGTGTCDSCHSATGDFAGIANRYSEQQLLAHIAYPAIPPSALQNADAASRRWQSQATVTLPSGEKITGEVIRKGEFFLTLRDSAGWTRTFSLEDKKISVELNDPLAFHKAQLKKYTDADLHNLLAYLETLK
ncbi:MAG TPA: c-type cytochrome [Candidatus Acidoferrum sp.]|jgi:cytochrome c oxidase cbb3-type subunit 3|nr:c-type cytochrome [Candidatus Acidoferrum sp.]